MRYYLDTRFEISYFPNPTMCLFLVYCADRMKLIVDLQSAVIKVVSNLPSDELSTDGVSFLISASIELAEMLVGFYIFPL